MSVQHYCPSCGSKTNSNSKFCESCGLELYLNESLSDDSLEFRKNKEDFKKADELSKPLKYAEDGDRFIAYIIDCILFSAIGRIIGLIFGIPLRMEMVGTFWNDNWPVIFASFLYLFLFEAFNNGQTLGKMVLKIQTVDEKSMEKITIRQAALHTVGKLFIPIDVILGLISRDKSESELEKNQVRFTQRISHTSVISLK